MSLLHKGKKVSNDTKTINEQTDHEWRKAVDYTWQKITILIADENNFNYVLAQ